MWRVQVPYRLLKAFHKVQQRLVRELEKKFSGKDVVLIANRRIMRATTSGRSNDRPRSRTLTSVSALPDTLSWLPNPVYTDLADMLGWERQDEWANLAVSSAVSSIHNKPRPSRLRLSIRSSGLHECQAT